MPRFIWKGLHASVEVWPETATAAPEPIFSGPVGPGVEIPADLPAGHEQVRGWLAFGLIEPVPERAGKARANKDAGDAPASKEQADG